MQQARRRGADITQQIVTLDRPLDLLCGFCICSPLYEIETDLPIVYCSDSTQQLMIETYATARNQPAGHKRAREELEQAALDRISAGIFPSQNTLESAVEHYGLARERAHLVLLGASVVPDAHDTIHADLPSRERLELIIVAADPVRKRLDLCVQITRILADRGWNVTLHSIGKPTRAAAAYDRVRVHGALSMADPIDRDIHKAMLRRSHFMLLPSLGEMFGIAPSEAAHFARPSLVSDIGGLSSAIEHGKTGLRLPVDAPAERYADEIVRIADDPVAYRAMSDAARTRAQDVLNWPAFSRSVLEVCRQVVKK
jgi:glycosyltransferase involved in cell wall biosynthesis